MTKGKTMNKLLYIAAVTTALTSVSLNANAQQAWTGGTTEFTDGSVTVTTPTINDTYINQVGNLSVYNSVNSNIALNETVTVGQDNTGALFVFKANNGSSPTNILGNLFTRLKDGAGNATSARGGNIFIQDQDGIMTGTDSVIDVNSIIMTTGDFDLGFFQTTGVVAIERIPGGGEIILEGTITVADRGLAAFVAPTVINRGLITAKMGRIELAGSTTGTTVDLYGDGLLEIRLDPNNTEKLLASNEGELDAEGGVVHMTTGAAEDIVNSIVNLDGVTRVASATQVGGKIILGGAQTNKVVVNNVVDASGALGGGEITIAAEDIEMTDTAELNVSALTDGNGGQIDLRARNNAILNNRVRATGGLNSGNGGTITTIANNDIAFGSNLDVSAEAFNGGDAGTWVMQETNLNITSDVAALFANTLGTGTSIDSKTTNQTKVSAETIWTGGGDLALNAVNHLASFFRLDGDGDLSLNSDNLVTIKGHTKAASIDVNAPVVDLNADLESSSITGMSDVVNVMSNFAGIQDAIEIAAVGGTVNVAADTYIGDFNVNKALTLNGAQTGVDARGRTGVAETIIETENGVLVSAGNTKIDGFTFTGGTNGLVVDGVDNVMVMNNIATNNTNTQTVRGTLMNWKTGVGIMARDGASNVTISQNAVDANTDGIRVVEAGSNILVENNKVTNTIDKGIIVKQSDGVEVRGNDLDDNNQGIRIHNADNTYVHNNKIDGTTTEGILVDNTSDNTRLVDNVINGAKDGIVIDGGVNNLVDDNDVKNFTETGVKVVSATDTKVTDNLIQYSFGKGVLVDDSTGTVVGGIGNTLRNRIFDVGTNGVEVNGGSDTSVIGNDIRRAQTGVWANTAGSLNVYKNIIDSAFTGVDISFSDNTKIVDNVIKNVSIGVFVEEGENVLIDDNDITNFNDAGIVIDRTVNADVTDNFIQSTQKGTIGIDVLDGMGAQIGGDGNTLRNRIYDVDTGVKLFGDTGTVIDGNDFRRTETGVLATDTVDGGMPFITRDLTVTDNTFDQGFRAIDLDSARNVLIGGFRDGNTINDFQTGVKVIGGNNVNIDDNIIRNVNYGIYADTVGQLNIEDNNIDGRYRQSGAGTTGIYVGNSYNAQIGGVNDGNYVEDFATGIRVVNSSSADIEYNRVEDTTANAISVSSSSYVDVNNNDVRDAGSNGIRVSKSFDADIIGNDVRRTGDDGIDVSGSRVADIRNNYVEDAGDDGIDVENTGTYNGYGVDIVNNRINGADEDGINVYNVSAVDVIGNTVTKAGRDGINVSWSNNADIKDNKILGTSAFRRWNGVDGAGRDGINVQDSAYADIEGNLIQAGFNSSRANGGNGAGRFGIYVDDAYAADVNENKILGRLFGGQGSGTDAIRVEDSSYADIDDNKVFNVGGDAVHVKRSYGVDIRQNEALGTFDDGIDVENSHNADIEDNILFGARNNGIEIEYSDDASITGNQARFVGMNGIYVEGGEGSEILSNVVSNAGENGIQVRNTIDTNIAGNTATDNNAAGILVNGAIGTAVINNNVSDNDIGIEVRGFVENDVEGEFIGEEGQFFETAFRTKSLGAPSDDTIISGNIIENNETAGVKTAGNGVGSVTMFDNLLDANTIGMLLEGGEIDISNLLEPNTINGGETAMRIIGEDVSLVNNTLGATIFSDQTGNYVELVDGALFNPGTPTIIDGLAASWDGIVPLNSPLGAGILTAAQRVAIENRLIDFDDNTTLGQILVGLTLDLAQEDIFALNLFSLSPDAANVNVTFRGLPLISQPDITALAALTPAAGGEDTAEDLANLEPAAGGEEGCWASVAETSFNGTVNFSFGADAITDEACAN